ncbi:WAS/WASL-interacting protein family member 3-like [Schistocerca nitens]|uniref:WAS/WASL-interacting protein family member 3-like n=1 Tax=Schistocerca nitens TaxID=7011 RepID=UPI002117C0F5|nr:WAS/WASL-interacting protein family member 3-like [Schistocerca nitens]
MATARSAPPQPPPTPPPPPPPPPLQNKPRRTQDDSDAWSTRSDVSPERKTDIALRNHTRTDLIRSSVLRRRDMPGIPSVLTYSHPPPAPQDGESKPQTSSDQNQIGTSETPPTCGRVRSVLCA